MMRRLVYFADPMCSWCWGFSPVIEKIAAAVDVPVQLVLGGLRAGEVRPLDDSTKAMIREHWDHVHAASQQPFDYDFFDRDGFIYDTEPACRAVVTMRGMDPESALPFLRRVQQAFYADGRDVTQTDTLAALSEEAGADPDSFRRLFESDDASHDTLQDFTFAQQIGVRGFPTLLALAGADFDLITSGFRPFEEVEPAIQEWMAAAAGP